MSETMDNEKFEKEALQVVENFLKSNMQVLIVSGRAGSGKSTLAGKIYELANKNNGSEYSQAQILSPTGQSVGLIKTFLKFQNKIVKRSIVKSIEEQQKILMMEII